MSSCFYSQLFGEDDPDQDVSPDTEDPEAAGVWIMVQRMPAGSIYFTTMREFIIKQLFCSTLKKCLNHSSINDGFFSVTQTKGFWCCILDHCSGIGFKKQGL